MAVLLARRRFGASAAESVDELAQPEQIGEPAKILDSVIGSDRRRSSRRRHLPIGPARRDQRPAAVRQNGEEIEDPAPPDGADHRQRPTFESMTLPRDRRRSGKIMAMGSLWPLRST
ncbi:MAG TPA: hypothetical protein VED87_10055, partial [Methylocystis sp.]|nr:hypothetical protein [Methylocystis sp.]